MLTRLKRRLATLLGSHYAATVSLVDRLITTFLLAFAGKAVVGGLFDVKHVADISLWQTCATAGAMAVLSAVKSAVMIKITGDPALLSAVSPTLRARRDAGHRPGHRVPVRKPRKATPVIAKPRHSV